MTNTNSNEQRSFAHLQNLAEFENILPGAAERLLKLAEDDQKHRHRTVNQKIIFTRVCIFSAVILSALATVFSAIEGEGVAAAFFSVTTFIGSFASIVALLRGGES